MRAYPPRRPSSINRLDLSALGGFIRFVNLRLAGQVTLTQGFTKYYAQNASITHVFLGIFASFVIASYAGQT